MHIDTNTFLYFVVFDSTLTSNPLLPTYMTQANKYLTLLLKPTPSLDCIKLENNGLTNIEVC